MRPAGGRARGRRFHREGGAQPALLGRSWWRRCDLLHVAFYDSKCINMIKGFVLISEIPLLHLYIIMRESLASGAFGYFIMRLVGFLSMILNCLDQGGGGRA